MRDSRLEFCSWGCVEGRAEIEKRKGEDKVDCISVGEKEFYLNSYEMGENFLSFEIGPVGFKDRKKLKEIIHKEPLVVRAGGEKIKVLIEAETKIDCFSTNHSTTFDISSVSFEEDS